MMGFCHIPTADLLNGLDLEKGRFHSRTDLDQIVTIQCLYVILDPLIGRRVCFERETVVVGLKSRVVVSGSRGTE